MANESVPNNVTNTNRVVDNIIKGFYRTETLNSSANVFTSFNDGGYVEFQRYRAYIDPGAEVFLKINNKKEDIYK